MAGAPAFVADMQPIAAVAMYVPAVQATVAAATFQGPRQVRALRAAAPFQGRHRLRAPRAAVACQGPRQVRAPLAAAVPSAVADRAAAAAEAADRVEVRLAVAADVINLT